MHRVEGKQNRASEGCTATHMILRTSKDEGIATTLCPEMRETKFLSTRTLSVIIGIIQVEPVTATGLILTY
ncbi:hypothetical protein VNO77_31466 [Canavalia gladiata]|uniref:Uncharacterized protein n=1 Tax=Canavalia gladiata TaxID=3824 RepID=A0AAN9KNZ5_CANGL